MAGIWVSMRVLQSATGIREKLVGARQNRDEAPLLVDKDRLD